MSRAESQNPGMCSFPGKKAIGASIRSFATLLASVNLSAGYFLYLVCPLARLPHVSSVQLAVWTTAADLTLLSHLLAFLDITCSIRYVLLYRLRHAWSFRRGHGDLLLLASSWPSHFSGLANDSSVLFLKLSPRASYVLHKKLLNTTLRYVT